MTHRASRIEAPPARGVLSSASLAESAAEGEAFAGEHQRILPAEVLAPFIAHFWGVSWTRGREVATVPHPSVHVTWEEDGAWIGGPKRALFRRQLSDSGSVFGIKFRPAMFGAFVGTPAGSFAEKRLELASVWAELAALWDGRGGPGTFGERLALTEDWLLSQVPTRSSAADFVRDAVELVERDRSLKRVDELAGRLGIGVRSLEREFRTHLGQTPKWVLGRYRLLEVVERLRTEELSLAALAAELGYHDQAHLHRDIRALTGLAPSALGRRLRTKAGT